MSDAASMSDEEIQLIHVAPENVHVHAGAGQQDELDDDFEDEDFADQEVQEPSKKKRKSYKDHKEKKADHGWKTVLETDNDADFEAGIAELERKGAGGTQQWLGRKNPRACGKEKMEKTASCPFSHPKNGGCEAQHKYLYYHTGRRLAQVFFHVHDH